jgi:hypothetical protein
MIIKGGGKVIQLTAAILFGITAGMIFNPRAADEAIALSGASGGVTLAHWPSGSTEKVGSHSSHEPQISADGRWIGFLSGGKLCFMKNDGSEFTNTGIGEFVDFEEDMDFRMTTNGIFWVSSGRIHRYNVATKTHTRLGVLLDTLGAKPCTGNDGYEIIGTAYNGACMLLCSNDGRKMWLYSPWDSGLPGYGCNQGGYCSEKPKGRGSHPYLIFSPDFAECTIRGWGGDWGHGRAMSANGFMMYIRLGEHRQWTPVVWFDEDTPPTIVAGKTSYGQSGNSESTSEWCDPYESPNPAVDPPFSQESRGNTACANNDSLMCSRGLKIFYNWRTTPTEKIGKFNGGAVTSFFWGPLPDPKSQVSSHFDKKVSGKAEITYIVEAGMLIVHALDGARISMQVFGPDGKHISQTSGSGRARVRLAQESAAPGVYLISGKAGEKSFVKRLCRVNR